MKQVADLDPDGLAARSVQTNDRHVGIMQLKDASVGLLDRCLSDLPLQVGAWGWVAGFLARGVEDENLASTTMRRNMNRTESAWRPSSSSAASLSVSRTYGSASLVPDRIWGFHHRTLSVSRL